jgi:putative aldouronate transport system substrate-binding protein
MLRKITVIALVMLLAIGSLAACNTATPTTAPTSTPAVTSAPASYFPLAETIRPTYQTWPIWNKTSKPFKDAPIVKWMTEKTNIDFEWITMASSSQMLEKQDVLIASGEFPDIMQWILDPKDAKGAGDAGLLVNFKDYLDIMPNFVSYLKQNSDYAQYLNSDGSIYQLRQMNFTKQPMDMMAYRKDLFDANGLKSGTWEELYDSLVKLKELYPESTPVCNQTDYGYTNLGWDRFQVLPGLYNDPLTGEVFFGALDQSDKLKYAISWWKKLWDAGLMHPDFFSMSTESANEAWIAGKAFWSMTQPDPFMWEQARTAEKSIPGAEITAMPYITNPNGQLGWIDGGSSVAWWYSTSISAKSKYVEQLVRYVDLGFTDEVRISQFYGVQGTSWMYNADHKIALISPYTSGSSELADLIGPYLSKCLVGDNELAMNAVQVKRWAFFDLWTDKFDKFPKGISTNFTDAMKEDAALIQTNVSKILDTNIVAFITGTRSMDEWPAFQQELKDAGALTLKQMNIDNRVDSISVYDKLVSEIK